MSEAPPQPDSCQWIVRGNLVYTDRIQIVYSSTIPACTQPVVEKWKDAEGFCNFQIMLSDQDEAIVQLFDDFTGTSVCRLDVVRLEP